MGCGMTARKYIEDYVTPTQVSTVLKRAATNYHFAEGKLWLEVILQAVRDMQGGAIDLQVKAWSFVQSKRFETVCDFAGLEPEFARGIISKVGSKV